jgi:hypothetical protein
MGGSYSAKRKVIIAYRVWLENIKGSDHLEDQCVDRNIISEPVLKK